MKLEFISAKGDVMPLTGNSRFKLSNVDGITSATVSVSSSTNSNIDGDFVTNVRTEPRSIVIDLAIERDVENVKRYIMQYVKPKLNCMLRLTQNDRTTQINGIIDEIDMPRYENPVTIQFSMHCSQPYWEDIEESSLDISEVFDLFYFTDYEDDMLYFPEEGIPFGEYDTNRTRVLQNDGDVAVGLKIHIVALGTVTNPVIYNENGDFIGVDITMDNNDEIVITTGKGEKTIELNGENIVSKIREGSTWLQLNVGENEFTIDSLDGTEENMYFVLSYKRRYV
nr:MAG TPA: tail protein [Bacteriophage sp.]